MIFVYSEKQIMKDDHWRQSLNPAVSIQQENCCGHYGEEILAPPPTTMLKDNPLSTVRDFLFRIFKSYSPYSEKNIRDKIIGTLN